MISGIFILMLTLKTNPLPENPDFKKNVINCSDIKYIATYENYKYVGIFYDGKDYLTNYTDSDILQKEIDECKKNDY